MRLRTLLIFPALLLLAGLSGCFENNPSDSGNKGVSEQDKVQSEKLTASADSVVSAMLKAGGGETPVSSMQGYIKTAESLYREAAEKDPSNSAANFGASLLGFELLLDNKDLDQIRKSLESWNTTLTDKTDPRYMISRFFLFGESTFQIGDSETGYDFTLDPQNALAALVLLVQSSLSNPDIVALFQTTIDTTVIPRLDRSITYMDNVLGDTSFKFTIEIEGEAKEIDLGEAYLLDGAMRVMRGSLKVMNAYQLSVPGASKFQDFSNPTAILPLIKAQDMNNGPFLTLRNRDMLPAARTDFIRAVADIRKGIEFIQSETDDQSNDLITAESLAEADSQIKDSISSQDIPIPVLAHAQDMAGLLDALSSMLGGAFTVEQAAGAEPVTVNLSAFLANGIPDLKKVIPYHTWVDLKTLPVTFTGRDISEEVVFIGGKTQTVYQLEVLEIYKNIINSSEPFTQYAGTFSSDGVFTVTGRVKYATDFSMTIEDLAAGASILDSGAIYLDSARRLSMTDAAWSKLKSYTLTHPDLAFDRVLDVMSLNFSLSNPFGVQGEDKVFRFAGTAEYANLDDTSMVYLSDRPNSGVEVEMPVFPDPTFGGLLPGMTQKRLEALMSEPAV